MCWIVMAILMYLGWIPGASSRDIGKDLERVTVHGMEIDVYTYRPRDCDNPSILFVFHGVNRNADDYRDRAQPVADAICLLVFAPHFDKDRFPNWRYHRAGVVRKGRAQSQEEWTAPIVQALVDLAKTRTNRPDVKVYFFGHSAGGQFLSRLFAYSPIDGVDRILISNPSVYVAPLLGEPAPYGFEGVFSSDIADARLRDYLALPITIYLGDADTGTKRLVQTEAAMRQGNNRLERGRAIFRQAHDIAKQRGWTCHWILVEVPNVGHSSRRMLKSPLMYYALTLKTILVE